MKLFKKNMYGFMNLETIKIINIIQNRFTFFYSKNEKKNILSVNTEQRTKLKYTLQKASENMQFVHNMSLQITK